MSIEIDLDFNPRSVAHQLIRDTPPAKPACFNTVNQWQDFLHWAHEAGDRVVRRQDTGKHRGERKVKTVFADDLHRLPCQDCPAWYRQAMWAAGRCSSHAPFVAPRRVFEWQPLMLHRHAGQGGGAAAAPALASA